MLRRVFQYSAIIIAIAIVYLSMIPSHSAPTLALSDKINHFMAYGALTGAMGLGWPRLTYLWLIAIPTCFGLGVELAQGVWGEGRFASGLDALANFLGAGAAALGLGVIRR